MSWVTEAIKWRHISPLKATWTEAGENEQSGWFNGDNFDVVLLAPFTTQRQANEDKLTHVIIHLSQQLFLLDSCSPLPPPHYWCLCSPPTSVLLPSRHSPTPDPDNPAAYNGQGHTSSSPTTGHDGPPRSRQAEPWQYPDYTAS